MRKIFLHLIAALLFALATGMRHGQAKPQQAACNRLARWNARYRSGAIDIGLADYYRRDAELLVVLHTGVATAVTPDPGPTRGDPSSDIARRVLAEVLTQPGDFSKKGSDP